MKLIISIVIISTVFLNSCSSPKDIKHSFFIAGHAYGNPLEKEKKKGLYPLFKKKIPFINQQLNLDMGFLLGDSVWKPDYWPEAIEDIKQFKMPIHVVRGNHDGKLKPFTERFGDTYKKFSYEGNLYIILDSNIDSWNISEDQLIFLMNTLRIDGKKANNIFIMVHHLLWYSKEKFNTPIPNSTTGRPDNTNFWSKIEPLLRNQTKPVFLLAGDMGAFPKEFRKQKSTIEYYYYNYDNITFIGTGMGGGVKDNFIIVDIHKDQTVSFRLIHLNGDEINGLGKLEDYLINSKN